VVTLTSLNIPDRVAVMTWTPVAGATDYDIAVGKTAGGEDVTKLSVAGGTTTATLSDLPPSTTIHVRVTPRVAGAAGTGGATSFWLVDFRAIVETLFLNSGPYNAGQFSGAPGWQEMRGWAPGSRIRILLASEVEDLRPTAEKVAAQLADMTGGVLTAFVESGGDNRWTPATEGPSGTVKVVHQGTTF
jgi:hypothetical protein